MHPELFLIVYRQQEREREQRLRRLQTAQERAIAPTVVRVGWLTTALRPVERLRGRARPVAPMADCCAMA